MGLGGACKEGGGDTGKAAQLNKRKQWNGCSLKRLLSVCQIVVVAFNGAP